MANPQRGLDKWKRNTAAATQAMKDGVADVSVSPGERAIAAKDKYIRNVNEAYNNGSYEAGLRSFSVGDWKQAMVDKGIPNMAQGVSKMSARSAANITAALNQANAIKSECDAMPNNSQADALAKVAKSMEMWKAYKASRTR